MKNILVPTDFSDNASFALDYAIDFAKLTGSKIVLLHVYRPVITYPRQPDSISFEQTDLLKKNCEERLASLSEKLSAKGVKHEVKNTIGFLADEADEMYKNKEIDMVIMGTAGASGIEEFLIGSNTATLIERLACPVLAVPSGVSFSDVSHILFATDFDEKDYQTIVEVGELASILDAKITVCHINKELYSEEQNKQMVKWFGEAVRGKMKYHNVEFKVANGSDVYESLNMVIDITRPDLIVMSTKKRSFFDKLFSRSLTKRMAYHTHIPLLAYQC